MMMNEPSALKFRATRGLRVPILATLLAMAIALPCAAQPTTLAAATAAAATAAAAPDTLATTSEIGSRLQALYPSTRFGAVNPTQWPGVFEVVMGTNLAYVDQSGQYFLFGHLYDMKAQRDMTAERKDLLARIDFDTLPLADAMKEVRGNGARVLAIFSDPDCPYCQLLEADLRPLTNVTIYTFLMPLVSLHPAAHRKAISVWCAKDRIAAWHATMWGGESIVDADCPHPVDRNVALGEQLGINGTPTLIAADGRMLPGAASKDQIEAWLQRSSVGTQVGAQVGAQGGANPKVAPQ
jgi:thiol:disulfide interchange protein DsbC